MNNQFEYSIYEEKGVKVHLLGADVSFFKFSNQENVSKAEKMIINKYGEGKIHKVIISSEDGVKKYESFIPAPLNEYKIITDYLTGLNWDLEKIDNY